MEDPIQKLKDKLQENKKRLNIARLPDEVKETFIKLANDKFCGDYGWCLQWSLEQSLEYQAMKNTFLQNIDMKLELILNKLNSVEIEETPESITMLDGKKRLKGGKIK